MMLVSVRVSECQSIDKRFVMFIQDNITSWDSSGPTGKSPERERLKHQHHHQSD